jgi:hypothetical protein
MRVFGGFDQQFNSTEVGHPPFEQVVLLIGLAGLPIFSLSFAAGRFQSSPQEKDRVNREIQNQRQRSEHDMDATRMLGGESGPQDMMLQKPL